LTPQYQKKHSEGSFYLEIDVMKKGFSQKKILIAAVVLLSLLVVRLANYNKPSYKADGARYAHGLYLENEPDQKRLYIVKRVIDGDTIVLTNGDRIRYIGINTPEIHHLQKGVEYCGKEAAEFNRKLVLGRLVRLEFDKERFDKYGRILAYVYLQDRTFVNAELVGQGYARVMTIKPNTKYANLFKRLQEKAKAKRLGVWNR
jgi:micrococcal nuclease